MDCDAPRLWWVSGDESTFTVMLRLAEILEDGKDGKELVRRRPREGTSGGRDEDTKATAVLF